MMLTPVDLIARHQQEMAERSAAGERARVANVTRLVEMYLTLGADAARLDGNRHDSELAEAKALAAHRWNQLIAQEQQIIREEAALAARPTKRPSHPTDAQLPDRTLEQQRRAWEEQTRYKQGALADLKAQAARERAELEAFITKKK